MNNIQVFDPSLCCSTGVCGVDVDQQLVQFSADVDWARRKGIALERFNLAQQPMAFVEHAPVRVLLERSGETALPVILVDGEVALAGRYPSRDELARWAGVELGIPVRVAGPASETSATEGPDAVAEPDSAGSGCCGGGGNC